MYDNHLKLVSNLNIIIYTRLSKEEVGKSKEEQSRSIINQVEICKRYIDDESKQYPNCQFKIISILKDDGISGTTFNRKDFKELIRLIEEKKANMVITTDLSRLGRNHIKTDDFIEEWFPNNNVRYVAIVEGVDTYTDCMNNDIAPIINWSNEHFAKLTSKKIKSRFNLLRSEGKWTGGEPPLGYKLDIKNKYHFVIDKMGAEVVRRIFSLFLQGNNFAKIAEILTTENIPIPSVIKGSRRNINKNLMELWSPETIKDILTNEIYIGNMVQGKTTTLNHKSKKIVYLPKENWSVVLNTHEPIIDYKIFEIAKSLIKTKKNENKKSYDYLLKGLLRCRECGHSIGIQHYHNRLNCYTICNYYKKYGRRKNLCTAHRFSYRELENLVIQNVKNECLKYVDIKKLESKIIKKQKYTVILENYKEEIESCKRNINTIEKEIDVIYEDKISGLINKIQYKRVVKPKYYRLQYEKTKLKRLIHESENINCDNTYLKRIEEMLKRPNRLLISRIIDKIYISEDGIIDIFYNVKRVDSSA